MDQQRVADISQLICDQQQIPVTDKEGHYIVSSRNTKIINDTRGRPGECES